MSIPDKNDRQRVEEIFEVAKRDTWHLELVGSDVRELCRIALRLMDRAAPSAIAATASQRRAAWDALPKCECTGEASGCHGYYNCKRKKCEGNCILPGWVHWNCPTHGPGGVSDGKGDKNGT